MRTPRSTSRRAVEAVAGDVAALLAIEPVEPPDVRGLRGQVGRLGDGVLHPRRELVAADAGRQRVGLGAPFEVDRVDLLQQLQPARWASRETRPDGRRSRIGGPPFVLKATP